MSSKQKTPKKERKPGAKTKLREYFLANVGIVLNSDQLSEISGGKHEFGRRIRDLRNEEGMNIATHNDRSDLRPGQYVLVSTKLLPFFDRSISKELRSFVLDRNGYTCQMCGIGAGEPHPANNGRKARLHIGHIIDKSMGGKDEANNLKAVCSVCNEGSSNLTLNRPDAIKLLAQIRRAPAGDQIDVLKWIVTKFPNQSQELLDEIKKAGDRPPDPTNKYL